MNGGLWIAKQSKIRFKNKIRKILKRNRGISLSQYIKEVNSLIPGWVRYFKLASSPTTLKALDGWIRRKLRCIRLKQCKKRKAIMNFLGLYGASRRSARLIAGSSRGWWRMSRSKAAEAAMSNFWFGEAGLITLTAVAESL